MKTGQPKPDPSRHRHRLSCLGCTPNGTSLQERLTVNKAVSFSSILNVSSDKNTNPDVSPWTSFKTWGTSRGEVSADICRSRGRLLRPRSFAHFVSSDFLISHGGSAFVGICPFGRRNGIRCSHLTLQSNWRALSAIPLRAQHVVAHQPIWMTTIASYRAPTIHMLLSSLLRA
ncbi:hypothetical protein BD779DRAFT_78260 [Infundibulicybe gibba]|nr:hypothetical protein BD779DRAFT_78260 [Infundibulicybe gibba]